MNRESLYHKTVDILVQSYFNDTLEHGNCYACAVGNMIAANSGFSFLKLKSSSCFFDKVFTGVGVLYWNKENDFSDNPVRLLNDGEFDSFDNDKQKELADSTGYSLKELAKIEFAFEEVTQSLDPSDFTDKHMFDGLMAVIECLDKIHRNNDSSICESSKKRFQKVLVDAT